MFKKGDRVECDYKGETVYGIVSRGGDKSVSIVLDGGEEQLKGGAGLFRYSDKSLPTDAPNLMDKWSIKKYQEIEGHGDSPTFSATICLNGKPVIRAGNNGWGGPNEYHTLNGVDREVEKQFYADVKSWMALFGDESTYDIGDMWIDWYQNNRPYGVTAEKYIGDFNEKMASFSKTS